MYFDFYKIALQYSYMVILYNLNIYQSTFNQTCSLCSSSLPLLLVFPMNKQENHKNYIALILGVLGYLLCVIFFLTGSSMQIGNIIGEGCGCNACCCSLADTIGHPPNCSICSRYIVKQSHIWLLKPLFSFQESNCKVQMLASF